MNELIPECPLTMARCMGGDRYILAVMISSSTVKKNSDYYKNSPWFYFQKISKQLSTRANRDFFCLVP